MLAAIASLLLAAGCATPDTRIAQHPEVFARLTPKDQALVRTGKVGLGMDEATVRLALGNPSRVSTVTKASGVSDIWHYEDTVYYDGAFLYWGRPVPYWNGRDIYFSDSPPDYWRAGPLTSADYNPIIIYDRFRIAFTNGKVAAIGQDLR